MEALNIFELKGLDEFKEPSVMKKIKSCIMADNPVFLHGKPGVGKSQRVLEIDPDAEVLELSLTPVEELSGVPIVDENGNLHIEQPEFLRRLNEKCEKEPDKIHILFLDELTNALPSIQTLAYSLVLERMVNHRWPLPDNVRIVAAGNEVEDSSVAEEMPEPLRDRFAHVNVGVSLNEWLEWANINNINDHIIDYLYYNPDKLSCEMVDSVTGENNISPRTWERASRVLDITNDYKYLIPILGEKMTLQFCRAEEIYDYSDYKKTPDDYLITMIKSNIPVFLHGKPGEGKSSRVKQIDPECSILELSLATIEDLQGLVLYDGEKVIRKMPQWLVELNDKCEKEPQKEHILFLDELTNAVPSIQQLAYSIVLNRRVANKWDLPSNVRIVAAGNEIEDSTVAQEMPLPLKDRFAHIRVESDIDQWIDWAIDNDIEISIISFLKSRENLLRIDEIGDPIIASITPRTWERASNILTKTKDVSMLKYVLGERLEKSFCNFYHVKEADSYLTCFDDENDEMYDPYSFLPFIVNLPEDELLEQLKCLVNSYFFDDMLELLNKIREHKHLSRIEDVQIYNYGPDPFAWRVVEPYTYRIVDVHGNHVKDISSSEFNHEYDDYAEQYNSEDDDYYDDYDDQNDQDDYDCYDDFDYDDYCDYEGEEEEEVDEEVEEEKVEDTLKVEDDWDDLIGRYGSKSIIRSNGTKKSLGKTPRKYTKIKREFSRDI